MRNSVAVIGLGNLLMQDEGVGLVAMHSVERDWMRGGVDFVAAGTPSMGLLHIFEGRRKLIFLDGGRCGIESGKFKRFRPDEVRSVKGISRFSLHDFDLLRLLECAEKLGIAGDKEIIIYCMEVRDMELGDCLSDKVLAGLPELVAAVTTELSNDFMEVTANE